jgi:hypothetical protein
MVRDRGRSQRSPSRRQRRRRIADNTAARTPEPEKICVVDGVDRTAAESVTEAIAPTRSTSSGIPYTHGILEWPSESG